MIEIISEKEIKKWKCVYKECEALCCERPPLITIGSVRRICDSTNYKPEDFIYTTPEKPGLFRVKTRAKDGRCFFLNDDYSCQLHKINKQPLVCRMLPFKFDGIIYGDHIILRLRAMKECPGYGIGENFNEKQKEEIERWASKFVAEIERYVRLKNQGLSFDEILRENWYDI